MSTASASSKAIWAATLLAVPTYSDWNDKMVGFVPTTMPINDPVINGSPSVILAPCSILNHRANILFAISALPMEYGQSNWDGYGAHPVSERSMQCAKLFADHLPVTIEEPDVAADADGEVTCEWYHDRDNQCLLTFGAEGIIYCNMKVNGNRIAAQYRIRDVDKVMSLVGEVADNV